MLRRGSSAACTAARAACLVILFVTSAPVGLTHQAGRTGSEQTDTDLHIRGAARGRAHRKETMVGPVRAHYHMARILLLASEQRDENVDSLAPREPADCRREYDEAAWKSDRISDSTGTELRRMNDPAAPCIAHFDTSGRHRPFLLDMVQPFN